MSSKKAIFVILILFFLCAVLSMWLFIPGKESAVALVYSNGNLVKSLPLSKDTSLTLETSFGGTNKIEVKDGKISVTEANCPDHVCISFGWCDSGMPIVCLPNGLIIEFPGGESYDNVSG